jgi:hypothetical protein
MQTEPLDTLLRSPMPPINTTQKILTPCPFPQSKTTWNRSISITASLAAAGRVAECSAFHALRQWVPRKEPLGTIDVTPLVMPFPLIHIRFCSKILAPLQIHVMPPSRDSPGRDAPQSTFDKGSVLPANIPLPETRPGTMYGTEINHPQHHHQRHSINAIDFAQRHPLPESRPTTIMERQSNGPLAATVEVSSALITTTCESLDADDYDLLTRTLPTWTLHRCGEGSRWPLS